MKIYFTASVVGKRYHLDKYKAIVAYLKSQGHEVMADHIIRTTEDEIHLETKEHREKFHKQLTGWITSSSCMVVEASFPSISVGYEISLALHWNKPILVLYSEGDPPSLLASLKEDKIICEKYNVAGLPPLLDDFLDYVAGSEDSRFTFFLSSHLAAYLEAAAKEAGVPKAVYLRGLIEADMHKTV